ncbi:nitrogen fixation protein NifQ [Kaarinaea lacus]
MANSTGLLNDNILAAMLASACAGEGSMPVYLGLGKTEYDKLMNCYFPGVELPIRSMAGIEIDALRREEQQDLRDLILEHRNSEDSINEWMAEILVQGCMGGNHLWQDLGLWSRKQLTALLENNFTALAKKNDRDMKWKKFFYKQLCQREGIYICRSPSCEVCPDYQNCFAPEE